MHSSVGLGGGVGPKAGRSRVEIALNQVLQLQGAAEHVTRATEKLKCYFCLVSVKRD